MGTGVAFAGSSSDAARPADTGRATAPAATDVSGATELVDGFIVGYKSQAAEAKSNEAAVKDAEAKAGKTGEPVSFEQRLGTGAALVELPEADEVQDAQKVAAAFLADPDVAYVVPDRRVYATAVDPAEYSYQWDLYETTAGMNVPAAWKQATGKGVTVAVIDTGITKHTELSAKLLPGYDFVSDTWTANDGGGRDNDPSDAGDWLKTGECGKDKYGNPVPPGTGTAPGTAPTSPARSRPRPTDTERSASPTRRTSCPSASWAGAAERPPTSSTPSPGRRAEP